MLGNALINKITNTNNLIHLSVSGSSLDRVRPSHTRHTPKSDLHRVREGQIDIYDRLWLMSRRDGGVLFR